MSDQQLSDYQVMIYIFERLRGCCKAILFLFLFKHLRKREGLDWINLNDEEFTRDLETGKFTILVIFTIIYLLQLLFAF